MINTTPKDVTLANNMVITAKIVQMRHHVVNVVRVTTPKTVLR